MLQTNLKILATVLATLGVYTLVANAIPQIESEVPEELSFSGDVSADELVDAGGRLFEGAGGCVACHGLGTRAPNLRTGEGGQGPIGVRCAERVQGEDCKAYLYESLVNPTAYVVDGYNPIMPDASRTMSPEQIWAVVAYLQDQGGEVTVSAADIQSSGGGTEPAAGGGQGGGAAPAAGGSGPAAGVSDPVEIMDAAGCFACHTMDDRGTELGPSFDGIGSRVSEDYIRRSILDPAADVSEGYEAMAGAMPPIFGDQLTAAQLEAVVRFLAERE